MPLRRSLRPLEIKKARRQLKKYLRTHGTYLILVYLRLPKEALDLPLSRIASITPSIDILRGGGCFPTSNSP